MLEILYGPDWCANSDALMARIAEDVRHRRGNRILLVPELISHETERRLCLAAGDTASRYAQVLSFSRLPRILAEYTHTQVPVCMDNAGRVLAMASAARQLHGSLKTYASVQYRPEFLTMMVDAVDECKRCCISAEDLQQTASRSEGILAQKTTELSLLLDAYDGICNNGRRDPRDLLNWVLDVLADSDFAQTHTIYIDGFPDLTRQHMLILQHFIDCCPNVVISLNCDSPYSTQLSFEKAARTASELLRYANAKKLTPVAPRLDALDYVRRHLYQGVLSADPELNDHIVLTAAPSIHRECQDVAGKILSLVRNGVRYRDIAVVCAQMPAYRAAIVHTFRRMGIPVYLSGTESVIDNPAIDTVFSILNVILCRFDLRSVLHYLRSALSPLDTETCDLVESYAIVWNVSGSGWNSVWEQHPDGLGGSFRQSDREKLSVIEQGRSSAMSPLVKLSEELRSASKVSEQVQALRQCLEAIGFEASLQRLAAQEEESGDTAVAQVLDQIHQILYDALDQMEDVLGDTAWDTESFSRMLSVLLSQYKVGTIPTVLDAVYVGPVTAMRCNRQSYLFAMGCVEGAFPGYNGSTGLFTDRERDQLRTLDLQLTGGALDGIQAEYAELYGVICGVSNKIYLSYSESEPSFVFNRLKKMITSDVRTAENETAPIDPFEAAALLVRSGCEDEANALGLSAEYQDVYSCAHYQSGSVHPDTMKDLIGRELRLFASNVDVFAGCRLRFLLRYLICLKERKVAKIDNLEFGNYVHYVLEKTVAEVMQLGGFHTVDLDTTEKIAHKHSEEYIRVYFAGLDSQRLEYFRKKNLQELDFVIRSLWEEMSKSLYVPVAVELNLDDRSKDNKAIRIRGKQMDGVLIGKVDRVDVYRDGSGAHTGNFFRIVDYKTGEKEFDYSDIYNGLNLQMLIYLFALEEKAVDLLGEDPIPSGVMYFPAMAEYIDHIDDPDKQEKSRRKSFRRNGLFLNDGYSINAMDPETSTQKATDSEITTDVLSGYLVDRKQLRQLRKYVYGFLEDMLDAVSRGDLAPNPYARGNGEYCDYCPFHHVCKVDDSLKKRQFGTLSHDDFWDWLGKKVK